MKKFLFVLSFLIIPITSSYANNEETISVFADTCENIDPEETISRARNRASDKAVFSAVDKLPVLELPRKEFDQYDFNILIYKLVDNYIEDLNVRTIKQDAQKICVEVDGYIKGSNIVSAVTETKKISDRRAAVRAQDNLSGKSVLETQKEIEKIIIKEADITAVDQQPKASGEIRRIKEIEDDISVPENGVLDFSNKTVENENKEFDDKMANPGKQKVIVQDSDTIIIVNEDDEETNTTPETVITEDKAKEIEQPKASVYISATKFFDSSSSQKYSDTLRELFKNNDYFNLTESRENADYVVNPNILRIKVDAINNITNRMQMVAMIEMEDTKDKNTFTEHQNRFTLLSVEDNEQEIAQDLMKKLLEKAGSQIMTKIENLERKKKNIKSLPKIITPGGTSSTLQDVLLSL